MRSAILGGALTLDLGLNAESWAEMAEPAVLEGIAVVLLP